MKRSTILLTGLGVLVLSGALVSFAQSENGDDDKMKKYHVIHQKNGEVVNYDTIVPMTSKYTPEQFLADKGISSEEAKIITLPNFSTSNFTLDHGKMDEDVHIMFKELHSGESHHDGNQEEVKVMVEIDDDGNRTTKKFVDGEEVEISDEELLEIDKSHAKDGHITIKMHGGEDAHDAKHIKIKHEEENNGERVEIICEVDDEGNMVTKKFVNGKEVELTEEEIEKMELHQLDQSGNVIIKIEDGDMDMDINVEEIMEELELDFTHLNMIGEGDSSHIEMIIKELKENLADLEGDIKILIDKLEIEGHEGFEEMHDMFIMHHGDHDNFHFEAHGDEDFTLVLVTENYNSEEKSFVAGLNSTDEKSGIKFYPNPNEGVVTVEFNQAEKVKTMIKVTDAQGKVVYKESLGKYTGNYKKEIDLKKHGAGTYLLHIEQGEKVTTRKLVVNV